MHALRPLSLVAFLAASTAAPALPLIESGQLAGATDVEVNGSLYDVLFADAPCTEIFSGCDETSDFFFQTTDDGVAAAQALLDQVFVGAYDTDTGLTAGCAAGGCFVFTPYAAHPAGPGFAFVGMTFNGETTDYAYNSAVGNVVSPSGVWAYWSPAQSAAVAAPGTLALIALGLPGMVAGMRRGRHIRCARCAPRDGNGDPRPRHDVEDSPCGSGFSRDSTSNRG